MNTTLLRPAAVAAATLVALGSMVVGSSGAQAASGTPECTNADLHASYHATDAGAGHRYGRLKLTNTSAATCFVQGWGGLSYVGDGNGTQIGAAAGRTPSKHVKVVLDPGESAVSLVDAVVAQNYPKKTCHPTAVQGFRVYAPDSTLSQFVKHPTTGCANAKVHLLQHQADRHA